MKALRKMVDAFGIRVDVERLRQGGVYAIDNGECAYATCRSYMQKGGDVQKYVREFEGLEKMSRGKVEAGLQKLNGLKINSST